MIEKVRRTLRPVLARLENLPVWVEILLFALVVIAAAGVRIHAIQVVPTYIWSKDASGYVDPVYPWLETGEWVFDGRRGPVYTMFIGYLARWFGGMPGVMYVQHLLVFLGIVGTCAAARVYFGRASAWIVAIVGISFATYGPPIHYAHLIRNETILFVCACFALAAWAVAIKRKSAFWLVLAGVSAGILTLTKNVFLPFPFMVALSTLWVLRSRLLVGVVHVAIFFAAFLSPFALESWHKQTARVVHPPEPQAGILLYGRVGQWTVLDGGIEQELKDAIRPVIEEYRKRTKLDNNIILREAVGRMKDIMYARGQSPTDVNRMCKAFALEAIKSQPQAYARQIMGDMRKVLFELGDGVDELEQGEVRGSIDRLLEREATHPILRVEETVKILEGRDSKAHLAQLRKSQALAWFVSNSPVIWAFVCVSLLLLLSNWDQRAVWLGHLALLGFTLVLLSTVGRPLQRYVVPIMPVVYWTITGMLVYLFQRLSKWVAAPDQAALPGRPLDQAAGAGVRG